MLFHAPIDPQSADILRELLTSDLEKFPHSAKDIAGAVKQWRQVHQIDSDVPLWHALTPMLAWSYAQPWADQIAEETLVHKWCHIVSRNEKDTFNADSAMVFSETAAEILAVVPETKKAAFASAAFSAVHRVLGTYFKHDYQQDDDDNSLPVEDISRMMVGLGSLASVDPTALSTWDKTPLSTAYLSLVYDMWGMAAKRGDDAIALANFLDSALPETFKRSTLFALDGATWAEAAALFTPALSAFIPATEAERAAIVHVAVTRRLEMMIAAAGVLAFYFGVPLALDKVQGTTAAQQALLVTLYNAFSCIACQMLIGLATLGVALHGMKMWRHRAQKERLCHLIVL